MIEGHQMHHEKTMCIRIWLEVGHNCKSRPVSPLGQALDWRVWVRGANGYDISPFVQKVVFRLNPSSAFVYPKRVLQEPPYEIQESGYSSIYIPISIHIKHNEHPKRLKLKYHLNLEKDEEGKSNCLYYDFGNPSQQLKECLLKCGGEIICDSSGSKMKDELLVLISDNKDNKNTDKKNKHIHAKDISFKFIEPVKWRKGHRTKLRTSPLLPCASSLIDFKEVLKTASMTDSEINTVSELFISLNSYSKSENAIELPAMSDPIYSMPELPLSLKASLSNIELDYTLR